MTRIRQTEVPWKPTKQDLEAAVDREIVDVLARQLDVVFCGINPGLYSGATGHHFARPGNRFWPALFGSGFTDRLFSPFEDRKLLQLGVGITNLVARTTARATDLSEEEIEAGGLALAGKVRRYRPRALAVLGMGAYRTAFHQKPVLGRQAADLGAAQLWVLPNPSGLQAHYQLPELIARFSELREAVADAG